MSVLLSILPADPSDALLRRNNKPWVHRLDKQLHLFSESLWHRIYMTAEEGRLRIVMFDGEFNRDARIVFIFKRNVTINQILPYLLMLA